MPGTAPTYSYCVTSSTMLTRFAPFTPFRSPWCTVSTRRWPGIPRGSGAARSAMLDVTARVFVHTLRFVA